MTIWFHSTILATGLAATVAVGIAGAAVYNSFDAPVAPKADRLPIAALSGGKRLRHGGDARQRRIRAEPPAGDRPGRQLRQRPLSFSSFFLTTS